MIDLEELQRALRTMRPHQPIYKVVRDELKLIGNWKYRPRGMALRGKESARPKKEVG